MNNAAWKHLGETFRLIALGQLAGLGYKALQGDALNWPMFASSVVVTIVLIAASTVCMTKVQE